MGIKRTCWDWEESIGNRVSTKNSSIQFQSSPGNMFSPNSQEQQTSNQIDQTSKVMTMTSTRVDCMWAVSLGSHVEPPRPLLSVHSLYSFYQSRTSGLLLNQAAIVSVVASPHGSCQLYSVVFSRMWILAWQHQIKKYKRENTVKGTPGYSNNGNF